MKQDNKVRILVGTRKGTYVVESDRNRKKWKVSPVAHEGSEIFHVVADPRHPGDLYAAVNSGFWGPMVERSRNWGKTWQEIATPLSPARKDRKPVFEEDSPNAPGKRAIINLWHIEPGLPSEPNTLFLGAEPHLLFRSTDLGGSWEPFPAINEHPNRKNWSPGAGGANLHTIILDPRDPKRFYIGMSAVGTFRTDDDGATFVPTNKGVLTPFLPGPTPETGQCVHHVAIDPADPETFYRQDHGGMYVSHDGMNKWTRIGKPLGDDFGFCVTSAPTAPGRAYFVRLDGQARVTGEGHFQVYEWNDRNKSWKKLLKSTDFPGHFGVQREGIAADSLKPHGIYVGTTTGQLFVSPNGGKSWQMVPFAFPGIHSVSVAGPTAA
jgi:hypothetical protein